MSFALISPEVAAGKVLRLRLALGATQRELAGLLGVHETTVSRWERGEARPDLAFLTLAVNHVTAGGDLAAIRAALAAAGEDSLVERAVAAWRLVARLVARLEAAAAADDSPLIRSTLARLDGGVAAAAESLGQFGATSDALDRLNAPGVAAAIVAARLARLDAAAGDGLRRQRLAAGYSQADMAALLDVTVQTWRRWERGKGRPGPATLRRVQLIATRRAAAASADGSALARLDAAVVAAAAESLGRLDAADGGCLRGTARSWWQRVLPGSRVL